MRGGLMRAAPDKARFVTDDGGVVKMDGLGCWVWVKVPESSSAIQGDQIPEAAVPTLQPKTGNIDATAWYGLYGEELRALAPKSG
jgi:hypothetical protein